MPSTTFLLLRRLDQSLEILPPPDGGAGPDSLRVLAYPAADQLQKFKAADLIYSVDLPAGYEIRPADWRPLIDDRDALELLIAELVFQNVAPLRFEPITATLHRRIESAIRLALSDLAHVFDLTTVDCEPLPDANAGVLVTVSGDHKNGDRRNFAIPIDWPD